MTKLRGYLAGNLIAGALLSLGLVTSAQAAIVITENGSTSGLTTVTFNDNDASATTVFGDLPGNNNRVQFTSTTDTLNPSSFNTVGTGNDFYYVIAQPDTSNNINNLTITTVGFAGFEAAYLNINSDDAFTLTAFDQNGASSVVTRTGGQANGNNRFLITTDASSYLARIVITAAAGSLGADGVDYVGDVRLGALVNTPVPGPLAGAGLPALLALGGFVWARRRKAAVPTAA